MQGGAQLGQTKVGIHCQGGHVGVPVPPGLPQLLSQGWLVHQLDMAGAAGQHGLQGGGGAGHVGGWAGNPGGWGDDAGVISGRNFKVRLVL